MFGVIVATIALMAILLYFRAKWVSLLRRRRNGFSCCDGCTGCSHRSDCTGCPYEDNSDSDRKID